MTRQYHDNTYLELVKHILETGVQKGDRTGTGTLSVFGYQMRFNLADSIVPILTTKKMHMRSILHEIIWYMAGDTNIKYLNDNGVRIWNEWADKNGDLGPVYGAMWRNWDAKQHMVWDNNDEQYFSVMVDGIDQIAEALDQIKNNPNSRRIIVTGWDPRTVPDPSLSFDENVANGKQALPPCHMIFQFYVANGKLSCQLYQRSCDVGLGVPFNIAQYSIMTLMMARCAGLEPGEFIWTGGDCHIYNNHIEQLTEQLTRQPFESPTLVLAGEQTNMEDFTFDDIDGIINYNHYDTIKMDVSI